MKVRLTRYNRIEKGHAGAVVDVTPARAAFLFETGLAEPLTVREQAAVPEVTAKRQTPEKRTESREAPEKAPAKKTTRARK